MIREIILLASWFVLIYLMYLLSAWAIKRYDAGEQKQIKP